MLGKCDSLYHITAVKLHRKRKDDQCCQYQDLRCLCCCHGKDPFYLSFLSDNIHDQDHSTGHCIINDKIPVVCPVEHSQKGCSCQELWHQKLSAPEFFFLCILECDLCCSYLFHPGIKQCKDQKNKHDIHNMCMQISKYEGITWKFMNRFVIYIRVESDISGRIWEPVTADFLSFQFLDPWNHACINNIVHISGHGNCDSGQKSCYRRQLFLPSADVSAQSVFHHLMHE